MSLKLYQKKRDFEKTKGPRGTERDSSTRLAERQASLGAEKLR